MTLLSNIFKVQKETEQPKTIEIRPVTQLESPETQNGEIEKDPNLFLQEAQQILTKAKEDAQKIIEEARQSLEQERVKFEKQKAEEFEKLKQEAYQIGLVEGKREAESQYESYIQEAQAIITLAKNEKQQMLEQSKNDILRIALKVAEKILNMTLEENNDAFLSLVKNALEETKGLNKVELYVHPSNYDYLLKEKDELVPFLGEQTELIILPSKKAKKNSCLLETPIGQVDASIDTQLLEIKNKLLEIVEEANSLEYRSNSTGD
jgi:flagellar assembly protein FliH